MPKKNYFDSVDTKAKFSELEKKLLDDWYKKGVVKKYLHKNKSSKKYFSFLDGPITANNPMGVHHAWGRTYKDLWQRFKNMQGFRQRFQNGFDAQGLWVEVEVEKELGFKSKKDIEAFGIEKFVQLCKDRVKKYSSVQTEQNKRLGYFMDWDNSYYTLSDDNNYMIWHFLKVCDDNGWLYKGHDSVPWCPRCETAISQHEMLTEDYKESTHESVYLAFPIKDYENEYLLVWTTTPWTVPANISVAVDTNLEYAKVKVGSKYYWVAKEGVARVFAGETYEVTDVKKGNLLVGWKYSGAFDNLPKVREVADKFTEKFHTVIATDNLILPITTTEGTGLVHTAVSAGTEDFKLGQKLGLPMIQVIEDDASYMRGLGFLTGLSAKKNPRIILDHLQELEKEGKHFFLKIENYTHRYPACWRCKTELVWKVTDEWYIAMDRAPHSKDGNQKTLRERMVDVAEKINWIPKFGLERELDWLKNMHDWLISKKNRFWGLALPVWECKKCGNFEVVGSKLELKEKTVEGWEEFSGKTPHKPQIDKLKLKCSKCGEIISRIEPVGNPWLDAGIVSYSTVSENNKACNFIDNATKPLYQTNKEEWKKWIPADFITESFPGQFKNWFYSLIAMSSVLENMEPFKTVLGFATLLAEDGRPMHKSLGNAIEFNEGAQKMGVDVMRFMYVRQNPADNLLFGYQIADETRRRFHLKLWNVYNFFVTYANLYGWRPKSKKAKAKSTNILDRWILARLDKTITLVTTSLEEHDASSASLEIEKFVDDLSVWYIRRSRGRVGISAEDSNDKNDFYESTHRVLTSLSKLLAPFTPFMSDLIYMNLTKEESVHLSDWPVAVGVDDDELLEKMEKLREIVEKIHAKRKEIQLAVRQPLAKAEVTTDFTNFGEELTELLKEEVNIKEIEWIKGEEVSVILDTNLTAELEEEAKTRQLIRMIQNQRKIKSIKITEEVLVTNDWFPESNNLTQLLKKTTSARKLSDGPFDVKRIS